MKRKSQFTKLDIARWIAVLPLTSLTIIFYAGVVDVWLYKVFLMYFDGETDGYIFSYFNAFMLASLISLGSYLISPKFKFKSTLITISIFFIFFVFFMINNPYARDRFNSFIVIYLITSILCLYIIYKKIISK